MYPGQPQQVMVLSQPIVAVTLPKNTQFFNVASPVVAHGHTIQSPTQPPTSANSKFQFNHNSRPFEPSKKGQHSLISQTANGYSHSEGKCSKPPTNDAHAVSTAAIKLQQQQQQSN